MYKPAVCIRKSVKKERLSRRLSIKKCNAISEGGKETVGIKCGGGVAFAPIAMTLSYPLLSYGWIRATLWVATRFPGPGPPPYRIQRLTTSS